MISTGDEPVIDQWSCDKLLSSVKKPLGELKSPKHAEGSMVWIVVPGGTKVCGIVTGAPLLEGGDIVYPVLVSGDSTTVTSSNIRKRR